MFVFVAVHVPDVVLTAVVDRFHDRFEVWGIFWNELICTTVT